MNISALITKQYTTVDAYAGTHAARDLLQTQDTIVVLKENVPIGILTASDLAMKTHQLVIDCFRHRPAANYGDSVNTVLKLMKTTGNVVLPVRTPEHFCGFIQQSTILFHIHAHYERQKLALLAAAHDLRNPIAALNMLGTILKADPALSNHDYLLSKISDTCNGAQLLIEDILTSEQFEEETVIMGDENLDELVDSCAASLSDKIKEKQLILSKKLCSNQIIKADRLKLTRAISNILWNSIKFTHPGGEITISTREMSEGRAVLVVQDTGIGMTKEDMVSHLGTVARSGSKQFLKEMSEKDGGSALATNIIGQFGSSFLPSSLSGVTLPFQVSASMRALWWLTRWRCSLRCFCSMCWCLFWCGSSSQPADPSKPQQGHVWVSDGSGSYELGEADNVTRGTKIIGMATCPAMDTF